MSSQNLSSAWLSRRHSMSALGARYRDSHSGTSFGTGPGILTASFARAGFSPERASHRTSLEGFIETLQRSGLNGPLLLSGIAEKIGEGGQFHVFKQEALFLTRNSWNTSLVAIKQPSFRSGRALDLAERNNERILHQIHIEIKALTNNRLRNHPNIVRLLGWAVGDEAWNNPLLLLLELAFSDLAQYLETNPHIGPSLKAILCGDVAAGVDAIHEAGFVHGDLKPGNVLLFLGRFRTVAKLADFGFAAEGGLPAPGGTQGWQAPDRVSSPEADRFSYGLLIWSIFFIGGATPPTNVHESSAAMAQRDLEKQDGTFPKDIYQMLASILRDSLNENPSGRPARLNDYFEHLENMHLESEHAEPELAQNLQQAFGRKGPGFTWEVPALPETLLKSLYRRWTNSQETSTAITSKQLLAIALNFTFRPPANSEKSIEIIVALLRSSAERGDPVSRVLSIKTAKHFLGEDATISWDEAKEWLMSAVSTGSIHARAELKRLDSNALTNSLMTFHRAGGFNLIYWDVGVAPDHPGRGPRKTFTDYGTLHWLAAFGTLDDLTSYLDSNTSLEIDLKTTRQETALFLACGRGSWSHARALLERGADATVKCTGLGLTCLHWAFAFEETTCKAAVQELSEAGANANALVAVELPFYHYPFVLPAGTPLHWAVATASHCAIKALLESGADPLIRNKSDPYMYDDRIRWLYATQGPDNEGCTYFEPNCMGLSALDIAALHRDPYIFESLVSRAQAVDVNSADEEGFTVLHRLASSHVFRTSRGSRYSSVPFRGYDEMGNAQEIIKAIIRLGGDVERLTSSAETAKRKERQTWQNKLPSYTPLMLAMLEGDYHLMQSLIDHGASVSTENIAKDVALDCISHRARDQPNLIKCMQTLLQNGADANRLSSHGTSPLFHAATAGQPAIFKLLLSRGAHIDSTGTVNTALESGQSAFEKLAAVSRDFFPQPKDETLWGLLSDYVFGSTDADGDRRRRVVQGGDPTGQTLLHVCSANALARSVEALLSNGASVNALQRKFVREEREGRAMKKVWFETPLDTLEATKRFHENLMRHRSVYSAQQLESMQNEWNDVSRILKSHGGRPCSEATFSEPWE
ncbi:ankyrin [Polyplosphaeria fusca]|uniref:Ankyrin n=1 Tax=Polyplosphaeria fusca TaxID=682080 RepID=A0A9P4QI48_9PLEO|nr:ankyrin [Polyplosphaeria fusca]